jgi:hypothetical protein
LSSMWDLDGDLLVDGNDDPRLIRRIKQLWCWEEKTTTFLRLHDQPHPSYNSGEVQCWSGGRHHHHHHIHMTESRQTESQSQISSYSSRPLCSMDA